MLKRIVSSSWSHESFYLWKGAIGGTVSGKMNCWHFVSCEVLHRVVVLCITFHFARIGTVAHLSVRLAKQRCGNP